MPKLTLIRGLPGSGKSTSIHGVPESAIQAMRERWEEVAV